MKESIYVKNKEKKMPRSDKDQGKGSKRVNEQ